jgi:hypothetical protein
MVGVFTNHSSTPWLVFLVAMVACSMKAMVGVSTNHQSMPWLVFLIAMVGVLTNHLQLI